MSENKKVFDVDGVENATGAIEELKGINSQENYNLENFLSCILDELKDIKKELKKINR